MQRTMSKKGSFDYLESQLLRRAEMLKTSLNLKWED